MSPAVDYLLKTMYLFSIALFCLPFVIPIPRRKYFILRFLIVIGMACGLIRFGDQIWVDTIAGSAFENFCMSVLVFGMILFLFDCSPWIGLYCITGAYALQRLNLHIIHSSFERVLHTGNGLGVFLAWNLFSFVIELIFAGMIFTRRLRKEGYRHMENRHNLFINALLMIGLITFNAVNTDFTMVIPKAVDIEVKIYSISACILVLFLLFEMFQRDKSEEEMRIIRNLWQKDKAQMDISRETIDLINIKCHDMKHLLPILAAGSDGSAREELDQLRDLMNIYDARIDTGSKILNLVLMEKSIICQKKQIRINCMAEGKKLSFMKESDLYSLFGNALDNAIRAVEKYEDPDRRVIHLLVGRAAGMISVRITNPYRGELVFRNGLPETDQKDANLHGFGMRSIKYLVHSYEGEMSVTAENQVFTLSILFPDPEEEKMDKNIKFGRSI